MQFAIKYHKYIIYNIYNNAIQMTVPKGSIALGIHESSHGYDFGKQKGTYFDYEMIPAEVKAYQRQYSYSPHSLPESYQLSRPKTLNQITPSWVLNIYIINKEGNIKFPYR